MSYSVFTDEDIAKFQEEYKKAVEEKENPNANQNEKKDYPEVPEGQHEVKVEKLEFLFFTYVDKKTGIEKKVGKVKTWLRIVGKSDPNKGQMIFIDNVIWNGKNAVDLNYGFLSALESGVEIPPITEGYDVYYNRLLPEIMSAIENKKEYSVIYKKDAKNYPTVTIEEVFYV